MTSSVEYDAELLVEHSGQIFPLAKDPVTIGAADDNRIILADPKVSPHHATIFWHAGLNSYVVQDLRSKAGTYVNERPILDLQQLRHGDIVRVGDTILDLRLRPVVDVQAEANYPPAAEQSQNSVFKSPVVLGLVIASLAGITLICLLVAGTLLLTSGRGVPDVIIQSPSENAQIAAGSEITVQAVASGASDIINLEISIDGAVVASAASMNSGGQSSLTAIKAWIFTLPGKHEISAIARTAGDKTSRATKVTVSVVDAGGTRPTSTSTPLPSDTPSPDITPTSTALPEETIPTLPEIEYFRANPDSIAAGGCATLEWGKVSGAVDVSIEPEIGPVGTPGSTTVCPAGTTTYTLIANGLGGKAETSTVVTVASSQVDLTIDAITFEPNPPTAGQNTEVKIVIRNGGDEAAGPFAWEWRAGTDARFGGRSGSLDGGETTIVTVRWTPSASYAQLDTVARVDINNEVPESDTGNNELWARVRVLEAETGPKTVTLTSDARLDGYRSNDGRGTHRDDIVVGNAELSPSVGEVIWRGFLSFNLSSIPAGAVIENVQLQFYQAKIGGAPYTKLGRMVLDHVNYGNSLDDSAYNVPALNSAVLAQQPVSGAWYVLSSAPVSDWLAVDVADGRPYFQLRLRWEVEQDGDGKEDYASFESANDFHGTGFAPSLIVTYTQ